MRRYVSDELRGVVNFSVFENISLEFFFLQEGEYLVAKDKYCYSCYRDKSTVIFAQESII